MNTVFRLHNTQQRSKTKRHHRHSPNTMPGWLLQSLGPPLHHHHVLLVILTLFIVQKLNKVLQIFIAAHHVVLYASFPSGVLAKGG